jgi:DNA modification methylase
VTPTWELREGDVLTELRRLPDASVSCVVTSPPYWSLRKYDAPDVVWGGDDPDCDHQLEGRSPRPKNNNATGKTTLTGGRGPSARGGAPGGYTGSRRWQHASVSRQETPDAWVSERTYQDSPIRDGDEGVGFDDAERTKAQRWREAATCARCGAWRGQLGLEPTPELFVAHTLAWLREVRRVLRDDGTVWLNLGDSYASGKGTAHNPGGGANSLEGHANLKDVEAYPLDRHNKSDLDRWGLKPKDLVLMPERVALAAQADGWWVRSRIIWHKPNAMPESVRDRPTDDLEHIWLLTKRARYWYDAEAVREPVQPQSLERWKPDSERVESIGSKNAEFAQTDLGRTRISEKSGPLVNPAGRNLRTVWTFPTAQTPEAHFATFPIELPTRCILAGCPREVCRRCGTVRVRVTETSRPTHKAGHDPTMETGRAGWNRERHGPARHRLKGRETELSARIAAALQGHEDEADELWSRTRWEHWVRPDAGGVRVPPPEAMAILVERFGLPAAVPSELIEAEAVGWSSCACAEPDYAPGVVLDPFAGLATTGLAALRCGRSFIGIELSPAYAEMARAKLAQWWRDTRLVAPETPDEQAALPLRCAT